jgi:hypothetical protein
MDQFHPEFLAEILNRDLFCLLNFLPKIFLKSEQYPLRVIFHFLLANH